jgi:UDP-galactopyranose mutase
MVFAGGRSLYESKRKRHPNTHLFPSSIDRQHFSKARTQEHEPADQASIPHPRLGYCGVIDERIDTELIAAIATMRSEWQIVMVGPVVKISEDDLPRAENIHYLGGKDYKQLPVYLGGWDVGLLPFALNESTRFISPTKTPEYLAAGLRVVSTPIADVVTPYGELDLVRIAATPGQFVQEIEFNLQPEQSDPEKNATWRAQVDQFLAGNSWDSTWLKMHALIHAALPGGCCAVADESAPEREVAEAGSSS